MSKALLLKEILTITSGKLLCEFGYLHEALDYLTGESLMTHQLIRAAQEARKYLVDLYPILAEIHVPEGLSTEELVEEFLDGLDKLGTPMIFDVEPMTVWERKNPIEELIEMRGSADGVIVVNME